MDHCRRPGCQEPVIWLINESTGKVAPIDAEAVFGGNIEVLPDPSTGEITRYRIVPKAERARRPYHLNHWATCKDKPPKPPKRDKRLPVVPKGAVAR